MFEHIRKGEIEKAEANKKFYDEYFSVADLPAEFYLETVFKVFQDFHLPRGLFEYQGRRVNPAAIRKTALLTVGRRARRHLLGGADRGGARSLHLDQAVPQETLCAGRRRTLRRILRNALADADLSAGPKYYPGEQLIFCVNPTNDAVILGPFRGELLRAILTAFAALILLGVAPASAGKLHAHAARFGRDEAGTARTASDSCSAEGEPASFAVDTGAYSSIITDEKRVALGLSQSLLRKMQLLADGRLIKYYTWTSLQIGDLHADNVLFSILPPGPASAVTGVGDDTDGILGPDIMANYDVDLDFGASEDQFLLPGPLSGAVVYWTKQPYAKIPFRLDEGLKIRFTITLDGKPLEVIMDTGAKTTVINVSHLRSIMGWSSDPPPNSFTRRSRMERRGWATPIRSNNSRSADWR